MCAAGVVESLPPLSPWNKKKKKKTPGSPGAAASVLFQTDAYPNCGSVAKINLITWPVSITVIVLRFKTSIEYNRPNFPRRSHY